jgi:hypothetical protein
LYTSYNPNGISSSKITIIKAVAASVGFGIPGGLFMLLHHLGVPMRNYREGYRMEDARERPEIEMIENDFIDLFKRIWKK